MKKLLLAVYLCSFVLSVDYNSEIQPIFDTNCGNCHLGNSSGGLNLSSYSDLMEGGNSGDAVEPGNSSSSVLFDRITRENSDAGDMPPGNSQLTPDEIALIAQWIDEGAHFEPDLIVGDLNDDSIVDVLDINIVANIALNQIDFDNAADFNADGIVNILDIIDLINIIFL